MSTAEAVPDGAILRTPAAVQQARLVSFIFTATRARDRLWISAADGVSEFLEDLL